MAHGDQVIETATSALYLVPALFGASGGIPRYGCLVLKALTQSVIRNVTVLSLGDPPATQLDRRYVHGKQVDYHGFGGDRLAFSRAAVAAQYRNRYDVLLAGHVNLAPLLFPPRLPRRGGPRHVSLIYGTDAWYRLPWYRRRCLRQAHLVISISHYTADLAATANEIPRNNIKVLHNCLDPTLFDPTSDSGSAPIQGTVTNAFLTVARMSRAEIGKGHRTVIRAMPAVLARVPDAEYWVVGDGDLRPDLQRLAFELGVSSRVRFLGRVSDTELDAIYRSCKVFIMPSKSEGFGFAFLEAMARNLPIVGGNRDASPEVIGDAGIFVDPEDAEQVASALTRLLEDSDLRACLARRARVRLEIYFGYERFRSTLVSYLSELLQAESASVPWWA